MSEFAILKAAIIAVKEVLSRSALSMSRSEYKELILDTAADIRKIGRVFNV